LVLLFFLAVFSLPADETAPPEAGKESADPAMELFVEDLRRRIKNEAAAELMSIRLWDVDVSIQASGYWKGTLSGSLGLSLTPLGAAAISPDSPVLFRQEADLSLSLWIRKRWFMEAGFLDDYNLNTYRAGYQGLPGEAIQYVGLGNRGLDFPNFPYLDLGGESPSSFGAYGRFGGGPLSLHALVRYDLAALEERIFVGNRERTFSYTPLTQPVRGRSFVLPGENLDAPPVVYLEDEQGDLRDQKGRRWRAAVPSEYAAGAALGLVELGAVPAGMVAAAYTRGGTYPWEDPAIIGAYGPPSGFLGEIQQWFAGINLANYPQPSGDGSGGPGTITLYQGGVPVAVALALYEPGSFSPFERMSRYGAASSASTDAALVRLSTGDRVSGYDVLPLDDSAVSTDIPLYASAEIRREIYELTGTNFPPDRKSVESRWPLADSYPHIYLPGSGAFTEDLGIRFTNYGSAGSYHIGSDVVPGSVQVWRGGLRDPRIVYDAASGVVALESPAGFNETIRITYLKRSVDRRSGSLAAGIGAVYNPDGPFSSELALGMRWNLEENAYAESGSLNPGTVGLGAKAAWDYGQLKAQLTAGLGFEQPDASGLYRAAGMEGHEISLALPSGSAFISEAPGQMTLGSRADLTYRNYREPGILGNLKSIDWDGALVVSGKSGPYPVNDPALTSRTHVLAAEFALGPGALWAGFEVPLGNDGALLEEAREIEIPFRFYGFDAPPSPGSGFKLIFQIGALSDKDLGYTENADLIVEETLFDITLGSFDTFPKSISFALNGEDRRKLRGAKFMRIFAVSTGSLPAIRGRVLLAPPIVRGLGFRPITVRGSQIAGAEDFGSPNSVSALEKSETGSSRLQDKYGDTIKRLHQDGQNQRVLELSWHGMDSGFSAGADGRISALPLSSYRKLVFFIKGPTAESPGFSGGETLRFILGRGPQSLARNEELNLDAEIPLSAFSPGAWSKVEITYRGENRGVRVEGRLVDGARLTYRGPGETAAEGAGETNAGYLAVFVSPDGAAPPELPNGGFLLDEVLLEDPSPVWQLNGGGSAEWNRPGPLISYRGTGIVSDISLSTALESGIRGDPFGPAPEGSGGVISRSSGELSLLGARVRGNVSLTALSGDFYWSGGHSLSRSWGPVSVEESFSAAPEDGAMDHRVGLGLSGPVSSRLNGEVFYEDERLDRKWNWSLDYAPSRNYIPALALETTAAWTESTPVPGEGLHNYGTTWARSWEPLIPDPGAGAVKRDSRGLIRITEKTSPVGAELSLEGSSAFSKTGNRTLSSSMIRLDIPMLIGPANLNFRGERRFRRRLVFSGKDVWEDGAKFGESIGDSLLLWGAVPLYSLFNPGLGAAMDQGLENSPSAALGEYSAFTDQAGVSLRHPPFYDRRALFLPSTAGLSATRILERKLDVRLDMLSLGGNLGFSAVNMFGALGMLPLFSFYQGDEFTHNLEISAAIPRQEKTSWRFQSRLGGSFSGFSGAALGFANTLTAGSTGWLESFILDWTAPTQKSLLSLLYNWIAAGIRGQSSWLAASGLMDAGYEQLRKESLELSVDHSEDYLQWTASLGHESIIRVLGRLYFSVFAKLNCAGNEETRSLSFAGTFGTTLNISF
jgi:hypothetical protein